MALSTTAVTGALARAARQARKHGGRSLPLVAYRSLARRAGFSPAAPRYRDLTGTTDDPLEALRRSRRAEPIIDVPLDRLRPYALSVAVTDRARNPFTRTVVEHLDGTSAGFASSALDRFYGSWQPRDLAAVTGTEGDVAPDLRAAPSPDCLPWIPGAWPDDIARGRDTHRRHMEDLFGPGDRPHGYRSFGPVTAVAGATFHADYVELADSVAEVGYRPELGEQPRFELLTDGERWAGRVLSGNHRVAVLAALGHPSLAMAVSRRVVRRADHRRWPGVRSGLYTPAQALAVFDRVLAGELPPGCVVPPADATRAPRPAPHPGGGALPPPTP